MFISFGQTPDTSLNLARNTHYAGGSAATELYLSDSPVPTRSPSVVSLSTRRYIKRMWATAAKWYRKHWTNPLESYMASAEEHRGLVYAGAAMLVLLIAYLDWVVPEDSIGFLYIAPVLLASAILRGWQIAALAAVCGTLREAFSPFEFFSAAHPAPGAAVRATTPYSTG